MAYYQGDYYQGDYYAGDPFLGSLLGLGAKLIGKGFKKIFRRPSKGSVWGGSGTMVASDRGFLQRAAPVAGRIARTGVGALGTGMAFGAGERMLMPSPSAMFGGPSYRPPGQGFVGPPAPAQVAGGGLCCPSGFHLAKDGSGRCVRNRSMNVANPRALRRSLRRVAGFGKLAQRSKRDIRRAAKAIGA